MIYAEEWRPVVGYEGLYEVSNKGRVRSVERTARFVSKNGGEGVRKVRAREMSLTLNPKSKRISVLLSKDGKTKRLSIHRLVAIAFVDNPNTDIYTEVNHKDENPQNNNADNLEWCGRKYNMTYGTVQERIDAKRRRRPVKGVNEAGEISYEAVTHARKDGFDPRGIYYSIHDGRPYKGYQWSFI